MRTLAILFILFYFLNALAVAPYGFKGQDQSTTLYSNVLQAPNSQVTNLGGINALIETGNKNILANASFEALIVSNVIPSWVLGDSLKTNETSIVIDGKRSLKANFTGDPLLLIQDSTTYAAQFADGVQGIAMIRIKTSVAGLRVCPRSGGVTLTSTCVSVVNNNKWGLYKVPFILGGTSNGISVNSNSVAVSGDFYFDDAFVGAVDLKVDGQTAIVQTSYISQTATFGNTNITGSLTSSSATSGVYSYNSSTGVYTALRNSVIHVNASFRNSGAATSIPLIFKNALDVSFSSTAATSALWSNASASFDVVPGDTFRIQNATGNTTDNQRILVTATAHERSSTYSSNNADTDWAPCQFSTLAWQGLGTVTNSLQCKRQGGDLLISGSLVLGTVSASAAQIPMPLWNGSQLAARSTANNITLGRIARSNNTANSTKDYTVVLTNSTTSVLQISVPEYAVTLNPLSPQIANNILANGDQLSFENIRVPIQFWENSNIIIGQFNGLESCQDSYTCTDTFSAKISSSGVVSDENLDFISGNCSVSGSSVYTCTLVNGLRGSGQNLTSGMNCSVSPNADGVGTQFVSVNGSSTTTLTFATVFNSGTGNRPFSVVCQKAGADYIAKSAKAVSSDQNVATPGQVKAVLVSALVTDGASTTTVSQDDSDFINGNCTNPSAGNYTCTFNTNYFTGQPHCWVQGSGNSRFSLAGSISSSSASFVFADSATTASDIGQFYLFCKGTRQ